MSDDAKIHSKIYLVQIMFFWYKIQKKSEIINLV